MQPERGSRPTPDNEAMWREYMTRGDPRERRVRRLLKAIPDGPRCAACAAPFGGLGGPLMRAVGKGPSTINPNVCNACFTFMRRNRGGAEIECSLLFADVRGSTAMAERLSPSEFRELMDRFYRVASRAVFDHDGGVDKFVGDEIRAMFYALPTGPRHAAQAVASAVDILRATGHEDAGGPWLPMGAGVHTGTAWVGALGDEQHVELTAIGDAVNVAARLAAAAGPGEILVSSAAAAAADLVGAAAGAPLALKGKAEPIDVVRIRIAPAA